MSKYVDFFGFGEESSYKNQKINGMLDKIEKYYYKPTMPSIGHVMVHSATCEACKKSMVIWEKLTLALEKRFPGKYLHEEVELNEHYEIDGETITGAFLYQKYKVTGVPFFLQNFKPTIVLRKKKTSAEVRQLTSTEFFTVHVGFLQPFKFIAASFGVPNDFIEDSIRG